MIEYEVVLTIRARDGKAVTGPLLTPIVTQTDQSLATILLTAWLSNGIVSDMNPNDMFGLAEKVESDLSKGKYKWVIDK